ncbi:MAG: hypothetical protein M9935_04275 [Kiritimatiellae bacterium]|nr:hypothetical protein [Kiritimatiellia bacterium]
MRRLRKWLDPDLWSSILMLALPFLGFGLLFLLTKPVSDTGPRRSPRHAVTARTQKVIVVPDALPREISETLAAVTPKSLVEVVNQMAMDPTLADTSVVVVTQSGLIPAAHTAAPKEAPATPAFRVGTFVQNLTSPDGIALDPRTGNFFVSEEEAHRIVMITPKGRTKTVITQDTRLYTMDGKTEKRIGPIKSPEGLAMDGSGHLYIVEDRPGGRILKISISEAGKVGPAEVIRVPGQAATFAWEGIAVRDSGELLLTGSTAEGAHYAAGGMAQGALVYRDIEGQWWVPIMRPLTSLSGVAFSVNGQFAIYCDEFTGTLGWIDLQTRYLREGATQTRFHSPEGVTSMPDGRIAIAEEGGRVSIVDPESGDVAILAEGLGQIESVLWDEMDQRLLVTSDGHGSVLELIPNSPYAYGMDRMARAPCMAEGAIRHVPDAAPDFLRPILEMGGLSELNPDFDLAFDELTRRVPMLAADARAILIPSMEKVPDPIEHLRFMALDPNRLNFDEPGFDFALSVVILRTRSGEIYKTQISRTVILTGNMWVGQFKNHGSFDVPIPFAYHAQPGPRGHAVIHFTGLGRSPDISIALNPDKPSESYMIVTHVNGTLEQYRLLQTVSPDGSDNCVISLPARRALMWMNITDAKIESGWINTASASQSAAVAASTSPAR